jgi:hypothetical protein
LTISINIDDLCQGYDSFGRPQIAMVAVGPKEGNMLKHLPICGALIVLVTGSANAQQRQAILQKIELPDAAFDLVVATPKAPIATYDLADTPDAYLMTLAGGELALGFENGADMLRMSELLRAPVGAIHVRDAVNNAETPVALYSVPKGMTIAAAMK